MQPTAKGFRYHIGIYGRRNVGKSTLINLITGQLTSIVSAQAGTTTDPVEKSMEFLPIGPVIFIDTAGIDDLGELGEQRVEKTIKTFDRTDLAILVTEASIWSEFEEKLLVEFRSRKIPLVIVLNKTDLYKSDPKIINYLKGEVLIEVAVTNQESLPLLKKAILAAVPESFFNNSAILRDILLPKEVVIYVIPIDKAAPKGRLLMPQVQSIRDSLDANAISIVIKETEFPEVLLYLRDKPKLVVVDSSIFPRIKDIVPIESWLTSFSILYSRLKGDLATQVLGVLALRNLLPGDKILISEACSHHAIDDDIGRVKLPRCMESYVGGALDIRVIRGHDFPENLAEYKLVILCGSCMFNRREVLNRILDCQKAHVPCTNYGLVLALCSNMLARVLEPFYELVKLINEHNVAGLG